jgi:hypothetical protein
VGLLLLVQGWVQSPVSRQRLLLVRIKPLLPVPRELRARLLKVL